MGNTRAVRAEARDALARRTQSGQVAATNRVTERRGVPRSDPRATIPARDHRGSRGVKCRPCLRSSVFGRVLESWTLGPCG